MHQTARHGYAAVHIHGHLFSMSSTLKYFNRYNCDGGKSVHIGRAKVTDEKVSFGAGQFVRRLQSGFLRQELPSGMDNGGRGVRPGLG
jgi:hypothetical protein